VINSAEKIRKGSGGSLAAAAKRNRTSPTQKAAKTAPITQTEIESWGKK